MLGVTSEKNIGSSWLMITVILLVTLRSFSCATLDDSVECDNSHKTSLYEGNECRTLTNENGICRRILDCGIYAEGLRNKTIKYKSICRCGFIRFTEVVCCPLSSRLPLTRSGTGVSKERPNQRTPSTIGDDHDRPSQAACSDWKLLDPASLGFHILGGVAVPAGMFAHMGALLQPTESFGQRDFVVRCGSSLISERYVLTAAHCVSDVLLLPTIVRFGVVVWNSDESPPTDVEIEDIYMHPDYSYPLKYHDIAIIKLVKNVEFNYLVRPACLYPNMADVDPAKALTVIGWGVTNATTRSLSDTLLMTNLTTVPLSNCNKSHIDFGVSRHYMNGLEGGQYCAFDKELNADACQSDSGGPLQLVQDKETQIVGIVSFGHLCGTALPSVYTRVAFYLDWIESVVWP